jgi:dolichol-phosphate mannosyltransferase
MDPDRRNRTVSIVFVVPTYNEAENLEVLAARLLRIEPELHVMCVDDSSPDGTGAIADELAAGNDRFHVIHRTGPRGYSAACKEGLTWSLEHAFGMVGTMDADLSHDPSSIPALVAALDSGADLAIGSRYVDGGGLAVDWGPARRAVSRVGSWYARLMVGTQVHDCTSGFRLYRSTCIGDIPLSEIRSEGYCFLIEVLGMVTDANATVVEVPITYVDRCSGSSKISRTIIMEALVLATWIGLARILGLRRRRRSTEH